MTIMLSPLFLFIIGVFFGSFLNVVADRLVNGESILWGRSHCDKCLHILSPSDLVPVFSFLILGAKCRYCKANLSWQYPLSEILTGLAFALCAIQVPLEDPVMLVFWLSIVSSCIVVIFADIRYRIIPDEIVIFLSVVACVYAMIFFPATLSIRILAGLIHFIFFFTLVLLTKGKGMGMGDVKFAFAMGMVLGVQVIIAFYLSFLTGAILSLILMIAQRKKLKSTIAFGPFLAGATIITFLFGDTLWVYGLRLMGM